MVRNFESRSLVLGCVSIILSIGMSACGSSSNSSTPTPTPTPTFSPTPTLQSCQYTESVASMQSRVDGGLNLYELYGEIERGRPLLEKLQQTSECLQTKEILKSTLWKAESQIAHIEVKRDAALCGAGSSSDFYACEKQVRADYAEKLGIINKYYRNK